MRRIDIENLLPEEMEKCLAEYQVMKSGKDLHCVDVD